MSTKDGLPINPKVVRWARERAGFSVGDASKIFKKINLWETGESQPSYPQLEQMSEKFKCPVAVFFFPAPPDIPSVESSFRTLTSSFVSNLPRTIKSFLRKGQAMQINLGELNDGKNPSNQLITRDLNFSDDSSLSEIAASIREYLGVSLDVQMGWRGADKALEAWREAFARVGIYVFKDAFHASDYFGFCLYDQEFPIIYINNSSTKTRQIFTLFHELGHLIFHTSGVDVQDESYIYSLAKDSRRIEVICNGLAAKILVPDDVLDQLLIDVAVDRELATRLANQFAVSREVIYRKFLDRGLIDQDEYQNAASEWGEQIQQKQGGSGNYYNSQFAYLGSRYIDLAFTRYHQQRFDSARLAEYLNIKPKNLPKFEEKFGGAF
jgi:Zn-dependent peptidase ImmA (M78 family)